jgi:glycolate oxidase iron-sulfur subunit
MSATPKTNPPGAFDDIHPPSLEIINKCVHCGFCLPTCPTYALWGEEMDSPRGRIYLMKMAAEGTATMNATWVGHFDACLGCVACMTACPSGVDYGKLIEATRSQIERQYRRSATERRFRRLLLRTMARPERLRILLLPMRIYQRTGLQVLARKTGLVNLLPQRFRSAEALLPKLTSNGALPRIIPAEGERRRRVGMLTGCVQSVMFSGVNKATARVLAAEGCEVVVPAGQQCCGALMVHAGEAREAQELARKTIQAFEAAEVDSIVINAAGCGSNMKEYGHLLRDDPEFAERARRFSAKCKDVSELLAELEPRAKRNPLPLRVAYHDACHLQHAQNIRTQPRALIQKIPELQLKEIPEAALCCGSAGIYNLVQPEAAQELGDRKAANITATKPDVVATGNPGCILQIQAALRRQGANIPVVHTIELLDASIRGASPTSFRS